MITKDEALKLALEALEETRNALAWFYDSYPQDVTEKGNELLPHVETVLTAIREALAEQPAQHQEPVAYVYEREIDGFGLRKDVQFLRPVEVGTDLYTSPPSHAQTIKDQEAAIHRLQKRYADLEAKIQPPRKPWVGLTDEEVWDEVKAADLDWQTGWSLDEDAPNRYITFARAIEAKLKEKNA